MNTQRARTPDEQKIAEQLICEEQRKPDQGMIGTPKFEEEIQRRLKESGSVGSFNPYDPFADVPEI